MIASLKLWEDPEVHLVASGAAGLGLSDPIDSNTYLVRDGHEALLVDAGATGDIGARVRRLCEDLGVRLKWLFLTHGHADHAGGVQSIRRACRDVQVLAGPTLVKRWDEEPDPVSLERAKRAGIYPNDFVLERPIVDRELIGGETFTLNTLEVQALHTPGHTPEHMVYVLTGKRGARLLFSGDHVFPGGHVAIEPIPGCDVAAYADSMRMLEGIDYSALFAGHLQPALTDRGNSISKALHRFDTLWLPRNLGEVLG